MAPRATHTTTETIAQPTPLYEKTEFRHKFVWSRLFFYSLLHVAALYGLIFVWWRCSWYTILFAFILGWFSNLSITAGAHRLWSHKAYSARFPLRLFLALTGALAVQESVYNWCRGHRAHHKYTDTDADPHNAKRGFFFSHIGWLMMSEHPDVSEKKEQLDMSDLLSDPVVHFQHKYYNILVLVIGVLLPTAIPFLLWSESLWYAFIVAGVIRLALTYNITFSVNSVAHMWGNHPYDDRIDPAQNIAVSFFALGEGWHNYHHVFPFDYRTSEFPWKINPTTQFIDLMNFLGLAYNLKSVPSEVIKARAEKSGDGSIHKRNTDKLPQNHED